ncbi:protein starmaker-like isoform X3 [Trachinotus anak]|uniref:protein starmaker-like isoform X3 n=1 Tax=Trachinotus anak TaxID=443729 RepID=UPI0039F1AF77
MKTGMLLSGFLLFLSRLCAASSDEPVYIKAGGTAHLSAGSVTNPIRSITWKHGPDIAMEWFKGNTDAYRHFKDRGSLNGSTGVMTITETIRSDSGTYTSEINGKVTGETRLLVVSPVSKPTLSKRCNEDMTSCVFTCEGSTTDAEPITYKWMSEEPIGTSTNELLITKEDKRPWFSCALHNPVSNETSDQVQNPFSLINDSDRNRIGIIIGVITAICVFLCICAFALYISRRGKQGRMRLEGREVGGAVQAVGYRYNKDPGGVSNDTETSPLMSNGTATPNQEQLVDDQGAGSPDNNQTPDQPQKPAASPDTNNLTESLTTVAEVHEVTLNQEQVADDQAAGSQDNNQTPDQLQTPAESPDTNITANQDPGCVVSHKSTNETEKSAVSVSSDQETPNKDQLVDDQGAGSQDNNQTPNQPQTPAESPDTNITANQDPGCVVSHKNTNETETSPLSNGETTPNQEQLVDDQGADSHDNNQTPDQPQTPAESPDTNNLTESLTTVAEVHEVTLNQEQVADDQAAGSQDNNQTPDQLQTPAESPDTNITANQDPGCVVSHKSTNETEKSAVSVSSDQETPNKDQLVDDQGAGSQDNNQTPNQPQTPAESPDTNITANQDPGCVVSHKNTNETETSPLSNGETTPNQEQLVDDQGADSHDNNQTPDQPQTPAESPDTNNLTVAEVHEVTLNQEQVADDQAAGSQDNNQTPDQLQTPAESPDTNITANQDPGCVVSHKSTNETEKSAVSVSSDQETPNKDQLVDDQGAGSQDNNQTPNQPQTPAESPDTNITANQDPGCVVSHKNTNETETSPLSNGETTPNQEQLVDDQGADSHDNNQTPDQPQTPAESPDTNNLTESLTTVAEVHEVTLNQEQVADDQAAGSQDNNQTPDQLQTPAESPDTNITANQDPGCVVSHKNTNETEKSAVSVSSDQETPNKDQLVDDQAAGPEVKDQS